MSEKVPTAQRVTRTSGLAVASVVLGILGFPLPWLKVATWQADFFVPFVFLLPPIFEIASLALGIIAFNQIRKSGGRIKGRGWATVGLIMGGVSLLLIGFMLLHPLHAVREKARVSQCLKNMQLISAAIGIYAEDHDGKIPQRFEDLRYYLPNLDKLLICPSAKDQTQYSYVVTGATNVWGVSSSTIIVLETEANHHGKRVVVFDDGRVELKADSEL